MQPCHPSTPPSLHPPVPVLAGLPPPSPPSPGPGRSLAFKNPHSERRAGIDSPPTSSFPRSSIYLPPALPFPSTSSDGGSSVTMGTREAEP